jgi:hypothetical protein
MVIQSAGRSLRERPKSKDLRLLFSRQIGHAVFEIALLAVLLGLGTGFALAQHDAGYAVLPRRAVKEMIGEEWFGGKITGSWEPTRSDVDSAELNLNEIVGLSRKSRFDWEHIENPERFFRQYVGILEGNRKMIFVNGFFLPDANRRSLKYFRVHLFEMADAGSCFWQAEFDVTAKQFVALNVSASLIPAPCNTMSP